KAKASKGKVIVTWKKSKGYKVDGYQIYKSTKKTTNFKKITTKTNKRYVNTKNLKSGKTYFYKVRGYKVIDGKTVYTKWGKVRVKSR
ncbi:MAG: fibronectin type III domain-containing protein, partial [Lachnospiraceae bacterium]